MILRIYADNNRVLTTFLDLAKVLDISRCKFIIKNNRLNSLLTHRNRLP